MTTTELNPTQTQPGVEVIEAAADTLDATLARIHAENKCLVSLDAAGDNYKITVQRAAQLPRAKELELCLT